MRCGVNCGCQDCKNTDGHPELLRVLGVEPASKRAKFGEDPSSAATSHVIHAPIGNIPSFSSSAPVTARASAFDKSLEQSSLPGWLKAILITGADRELIKAVSNPIMSHVLGITTTRRRTAAETILDEFLTTVEYKDIAVEMAAAARKENDTVLARVLEDEDVKRKAVSQQKAIEDAESAKESQKSESVEENGAKEAPNDSSASEPMAAPVPSISTSSSTTNASTILSTSLELEDSPTKDPAATSDSPFAYLTQPSYNPGNQPRLGLRDFEENAEMLVDAAQEAVLLKILESRLRLIREKVIKNEEEKSRDKARKAAAKRKEEEVNASDVETEESQEHSPTAAESSNSSSRITPPPEDRDTQPLEDSSHTPRMEVDA